MNNCNLRINVANSKALVALANDCGTNITKLLTYTKYVVQKQNEDGTCIPTPEFAKWYHDTYNERVNFGTTKYKQLKNRIVRYCEEKIGSSTRNERVNRLNTIISAFGYTSHSARNLCKDVFCANMSRVKDVVDDFRLTNPAIYARTKEKIDKYGEKTWLVESVKDWIIEELAKRIAIKTKRINKSITQKEQQLILKEIKNNILNQKRPYVEEVLGKDDMSIQDKNLTALCFELITNPVAFIDEISKDSRLISLRDAQNNDTFGDKEARQTNNETADIQGQNGEDIEDTVDDSDEEGLWQFDHSGTVTSAIMHVDDRIRHYFHGLRKLNSYTTYENYKQSPDFDLNNDLGLPTTMNVKECISVMYHYADYSNGIDGMIKSIHHIAETLPGYKSFHVFADELENNLDFCNDVFRTFGKPVVVKTQTITEFGNTIDRISNTRSDRFTAFKYDCMNAVRITALMNDSEYELNDVIDLQDIMKRFKDEINSNKNGDRQDFISKVANKIKGYYPNIQTDAVAAYVNSHKQKDDSINPYKNLQYLLDCVVSTIKASENTKRNYEESVKNHDYSKSYISVDTQTAAINIAQNLLPYSLISVDTNSTNVEGNQSSDAINNNMLTDFFTMLKDDVALKNYMQSKMRFRQYKYSNILVNRDGVNEGLFEYNETDGTYNVIDHSKSDIPFMALSLFDGAKNNDLDKESLYAKMSGELDYIKSLWTAFFNSTDSNTKNNTNRARYFMRTPSDAPRNYSIYAPRYNVDTLFAPVDSQAAIIEKANIEKHVHRKNLTEADVQAAKNSAFIIVYNDNDVIKHLTTEDGKITIGLPRTIRANKSYKDGDVVTFKFKSNTGNYGDGKNIYLISGKISNGRLVDGTLQGIYNDDLSQDIKDKLEQYKTKQIESKNLVEYKLRRKHPVFQQLKNMFKQELLDAAVGLDKFFETSDSGIVAFDSEEPRFKLGAANDATTVKNAFENYHYKGGHVINKNEEDNRWHLTGNVFHSDRFITYDRVNKKTRNIGQEIIDEAFDFLYGGANNKYLHVTKDVHGHVTDIQLTPEQEQIIDEKLKDFINTYVYDNYLELSEHEETLGTFNHDSVAEFVLNYHIMFNNFNDLFEGDTKFYSDVKKLYKRAKETQGSGIWYAFTNLRETTDTPRHEIKSALDGITFGNDKRVIKAYNKFRAITIANTKLVNTDAIKVLRKKLETDCNLSKEDTDRLLKGYEEGTVVNDAQSYITFEEWVRRITGRGQLAKYKDLIDKIYNGEEISGEEFVQVQKNFYYNQDNNEESELFYPNQVKNAEFVLIPQFVKGTHLEIVYDMMQKYSIDQINTYETSKAGNSDVLELFDKKTGDIKADIVEEWRNPKDAKQSVFGQNVQRAKKLLTYNTLRTQQETPQHMNAENKAGLQIVKKLFDNVQRGSALYKYKKEFFDLFSANIDESHEDLMRELGIETDENGDIVFEENVNGELIPKGFNEKVFYDKLKHELMKRGMDSNALDYVTFDAEGVAPIMPNYRTNISTKLENIAQAIFNNSITRQTLPGFHAAQITNIGWKAIDKNTQTIYSKELKYHVGEKGEYVDYVEIMLPASAFGFQRKTKDGKIKSKDDLLTELQEAGLDEIIGYRIPTEGKQSVCKMKIVGFIDDSYGSTIVVPNDWVTQTGSDFDIDSVYGIQFHTYIDEDGHIQAVKYKEAGDFNKEDWYKYLRRNGIKQRDVLMEVLAGRKERIDILNEQETATYNKLDIKTKEVISLFHKAFNELYDNEKNKTIYKERVQQSIELLTQRIETFKNEYDNKEKEAIQNHITSLKDILNNIKSNDEEIFKKYEQKAKDKNLMDYETYIEWCNNNVVKANTKQARDNKICANMIAILQDNASLEENLSRSNFDDILAARDRLLKFINAGRSDNRSAYSILDQAKFQYESTSAMTLKGISVMYDTFCSICNTIQPIIKGCKISVIYFQSEIDKNAKERYKVTETRNHDVKVTFDKYGWSSDNKNVIGKILTSYTSQTTAHILDVVKKGFVPNVTQLTFPVYKLLANIGIDYETICAFIMQNGIKRINDAASKQNSVYNNIYGNPIDIAIKEIATELGYTNIEYDRVEDVLDMIAKDYANEFNQVTHHMIELSLKEEEGDNIVTLNKKLLENNIKQPRTDTNALLFDLGVVLQYARLQELSNKIEPIVHATRSDKFGAKQTLFATNDVFEKAQQLSDSKNPPLVLDDGRNIIDAVYPDIKNGILSFLKSKEQSEYKPLCAFLKRSTAASLLINRRLFLTESKHFRDIIDALNNKLNKPLNEEQVSEFKKYIIGALYVDCDNIMSPIGYNIGADNNNPIGFVKLDNSTSSEQKEKAYKKELERVIGYNVPPQIDFNPDNVYEPTQDEVNEFCKLTPAQKVLWIQKNMIDSGVFAYVQANVAPYHTKRGTSIGSHTLRFTDGNTDIEDIYAMFENAFASANPFIALTAYDVIKYAHIVENYDIKRGAVTKTIPNSVLYNDFGIFGTGIESELSHKVKNVYDLIRTSGDKIYDDFVRSRNLQNIRTHRLEEDLKIRESGIIIAKTKDKLLKYDIIRETTDGDISNSYVNLISTVKNPKTKKKENRKTTYKIIQGNNSFFFLYPLNPLRQNEHSDVSEMEGHPYKTKEYYEKIISDFNKELNQNEIEDKLITAAFDRIAKETDASQYTSKSTNGIDANATINVDFNNPPINLYETIKKLKKDIEDNYGNNNIEPPFIIGKYSGFTIGKYVKKEGKAYAFEPQTLPLHVGTADEQLRTFSIYRVPSNWFKNHINPYLGNNKPISQSDEKYAHIINNLRKNDIVKPNLNEYYIVKPLSNDDLQKLEEEKETAKNEEKKNNIGLKSSTTTESVSSDFYRQIEQEYNVNANDFTEKAHNYFKRKGIDLSNSANKTKEIFAATAEYTVSQKTKLLWELEHFYKDPATDNYLSVIDVDVFDLIKNDEQLRNKYLKLMLDCDSFVKNFEKVYTLHLAAEDDDLANSINTIREAVSDIQNDYLHKLGRELFGSIYLKDESTNPLIKSDMIDIFSSFYSTGHLEALYNDLQETHNPAIQVIAKEVTSNLISREREATKHVLAFRKRFEAIVQDAKAHGLNIDLNNIIDENGRFIQAYSHNFIEDGKQLYTDVQESIKEYGRGSIEHLKEKLKYEKWKLKHLNQEADDAYYAAKIKLDEEMIKVHPIIFEAYNKVLAKIYSIQMNRNADGTLDDKYQEELNEAKKELNDITTGAYYDPVSGEIIDKPSFDPSIVKTLSEEEKRARILNSRESYDAISAYIKNLRELRNIYFVQDTEYGFDEQLNKNLHIVASYEVRDPQGHLRTPMNLLLENEEYRKAKEWLSKNAKMSTVGANEEGVKLLEEIRKAFKILKRNSSGQVFNRLVKEKKAKDNKGTIDGTQFTEKEINNIRNEQLREFGFRDGDPYGDRHLISSSKQHDVIYTTEFYRGISSNGTLNPEYLERIEEINKLLRPYFNTATKTIDFNLIPNNEKGKEIYEKLEKLYEQLYEDENAENPEDRLKHTTGTNGKSIRAFIEKYVEFDTNVEEFEKQEKFAKAKGGSYYDAWKRANILVIDGKAVPNPYIYGYMKPKKEYENRFTDTSRTRALQLINQTMVSTPTEYYYQMFEKMQKAGKEAFDKWYEQNHIYNPNTHTIEPIRCWVTLEYNKNIENIIQTWTPNYNRTVSVVAKDKRNPDYDKTRSFYQNYKKGSGYDNPTMHNANEYELQIKDLFKEELIRLVKTDKSKKYINDDYMPSVATKEKDAMYFVKETLALAGFSSGYTGKNPFKDKVTYDTDEIEDMPMLQLLNQKTRKEANIEKPVRGKNESDEAFDKRMAEYQIQITKLKKENEEAHKAVLDRDWESVMEKFILAAEKFNAIQDNKYMLYYGRSILEDLITTNVRQYGFFGDYKIENESVVKEKNKELIDQYETWIRRLIYNQWRKPHARITKLASYLQSITSAQYMMANVRGGIANVTLGRSQIMMERMAKEYFNHKDFITGESRFMKAIPNLLADMYKDTASSLESAIVKHFYVIDNNGVSYRNNDAADVQERAFEFLQDVFYSPNGIGENYMQLSVLFAALNSNRLYEEVDDITGKIKLVYKTEEEAIKDCREQALKIVLSKRGTTNDEKDAAIKEFDNFIQNIKADENELRKYAHYRRDAITVFAKSNLTKEEINDFVDISKQLKEETIADFNNDEKHPTIYSQLKLEDNGMLGFKEDSLLAKHDVVSTGNSVSDSYKLLGEFRGRVVSINHKIHGVYDKLGQGQIEKEWYGALLTQYHKHIPMGIKKRFQYEGSYNEERGSIEKGFYISLFDFIATPFREQKEQLQLSDKEITVIESIQNTFKAFINLFTQWSVNWNLLADYEKANIKRALGEMYGVLAAMALALATQLLGDDDDEDNVLYNLALYEADRLASESMQFNPIGLALSGGSDIKKLWSTPIAAQTGIEDLIKSMGLLSDMIMQGDEFDPYYHTGRYAGENKFWVYIQRRIPIWRGIKSGFIDISDTNSYYKYGENMLGIIDIKQVAEDIKE